MRIEKVKRCESERKSRRGSRPQLLGELTTEQFRQRLAGLVDSQEQQSVDRKELKELSVKFAAALPRMFGDELDRMTLWDRIGSGIQAAFASTAGDDHEFFIQQVLNHIKASPAKASLNDDVREVIQTLDGWQLEDRRAWITYFNSHLVPILVRARVDWTKAKQSRRRS